MKNEKLWKNYNPHTWLVEISATTCRRQFLESFDM